MMVRSNSDARPSAYDDMKDKFRPSHADYTYQAKYGVRDHRGGRAQFGRGRPWAGWRSGAIAKKILSLAAHVEIRAFVTERP